jgi:hypothetical protein
MCVHTTTYSGSRAISANAVAEPNRELHMDVKSLAPVASKTPIIPYAVRNARKGDANSSHFAICDIQRVVSTSSSSESSIIWWLEISEPRKD